MPNENFNQNGRLLHKPYWRYQHASCLCSRKNDFYQLKTINYQWTQNRKIMLDLDEKKTG
jgi:hypothetical protein